MDDGHQPQSVETGTVGSEASLSARRASDDAVISMRTTLQQYYKDAQRARAEVQALHKQASEMVDGLLLGLIRVADSCEASVNSLKAASKKPDAEAIRAFGVQYELVKDILDAHHVFNVPVAGKRYDEVEFNGVRIEQPWQVVAASGAGSADRSSCVKSVILPLWVQAHGNRFRVLRRAEVTY